MAAFLVNAQAETDISEKSKPYYAGIGFHWESINPHLRATPTGTNAGLYSVQSIKKNYQRGPAPRLFLGKEDPYYFGNFGGRVEGELFFLHSKIKGSQVIVTAPTVLGIPEIRFHYGASIAGQLMKKFSPHLDGYTGLRLSVTWTEVSYFVDNQGLLKYSTGNKFCFLPAISPHVGLIYNASKDLFYYLEGSVSFYQRFTNSGNISDLIGFNTRIQPVSAGIGVGAGWRF